MTSPTSPSWLRRHYPKLLLALTAAASVGVGLHYTQHKTPESHLAQAANLQRQGDIKGAVIELKTALQAMPQNPEVRWKLAQALFASSEFAGAEKELLKARELGLQSDELSILLARTWLKLKNTDRVIDEIRSREGAPGAVNASLLALRAEAQLVRNETYAAQETLADADKQAPDNPDTLMVRARLAQSQGKVDTALQLVDKALATNGGNPDSWVVKGTLLQTLKQDVPALAAYTRALTLAPGNVPARLATIQISLDTGNLEKGAAELALLDKHAPGNIYGMFLHARLDYAHKHYNEALDMVQRVLRDASDYLPAQLLAGESCLAVGKREEALVHLQLVLDAQPNNFYTRRLLAITLMELGQLERAKKLADELGNEHDDAQVALLRGEIALRGGNYSVASALFKKLTGTTAATPSLFMKLAASQEGSGDTGAALQSLARASELDKASWEADSQMATLLLKHRNFDEAFRAVDRIAARKANAALVLNMRGVILVAKKDYAQARVSLEKALQADPTFMPAVSNLANLDLEAKDFKSARMRYEEALKHSPNEANLYLALASIATLQKDDAAYRDYLDKAKHANVKNPEARQLLVRYWLNKGNPSQALWEARDALSSTGLKGFYEQISTAQMAMGDKQAALDALQRWTKESPASAPAWIRLTQLQVELQNITAARQALNQALKLQPDLLEAKLLNMSFLTRDANYHDALAIAREIQAKYPNAATGYYGEAEILSRENKPIAAADLYAKAARANGGSSHMLSLAARSYVQGGQTAAGINLIKSWLRDHADDAQMHKELALLHMMTQHLREASEEYRSALHINPKDLVATNNLALLLNDLNDPGAVSVAEQAVKLAPGNPDVMDTLGTVLIKNGQTKRGVTLIKQASDTKPESYEYQWHYAKGLVALGENVLARQELDRMLSSGKAFPQADEARKLMVSLKR